MADLSRSGGEGVPRDLTGAVLRRLSWAPEDVSGSLQAVYDHVEREALQAIAWYMARKSLRSSLSRALRLGAIAWATLGGLVPLIAATRLFPAAILPEMAQLGYVCFAVAAGCVAVDRFFGISTGWMRCVTSAFTLQQRLLELQLDWSILQARLGGLPPTPEQVERMLLRLKDFGGSVNQVIDKETQSWVAEFQANLAELHKEGKARQDLAPAGPRRPDQP